MDLTTRCPQCGTVFQASLADLQLRKGYIRCVQCSHIFDGYAEVQSGPSGSPTVSTPLVQPAASAPEPHIPPVIPEPDGDEAPDADAVPQVFRSGRDPAISNPVTARPETGGWRVEPRFDAGPPPEPFVVEARLGHHSQGGSAAPLMQSDDVPPWWQGIARILSGGLLLVLLVLAVTQLAYVYRAQLAQAAPSLRPWLQQACVPLRCQVPYARDLGQISIIGSALKIQDVLANDASSDGSASSLDQAKPDAPDTGSRHYVLQATLRNQARQAQEWPSLILDLKDAAGTLLVRRNLSAVDYLGAGPAQQPFAPQSEVLIRLPFTLNGLRVNGYQIDLFYP